ncbi:hypothetical protein MCEJIRE27_00389 [Candidatus Nanopelagicaceae bacterium]
MAKKFCEKCLTPSEMSNFECSQCGGSSFIHKLPSSDYCDCGIPDINGTQCKKCSLEIDPSRLAKLGKSGFTSSASKAPTPTKRGEINEMSQFSATGKTIDDLIRAQNRTTHAVRAFVRFLFIQLSALTLSAFIWNVAAGFADSESCSYSGTNCTGNSALQIIAGLVMLVGIGWSSSAGWSELEKSNIS